jgi:hypothetical protein
MQGRPSAQKKMEDDASAEPKMFVFGGLSLRPP